MGFVLTDDECPRTECTQMITAASTVCYSFLPWPRHRVSGSKGWHIHDTYFTSEAIAVVIHFSPYIAFFDTTRQKCVKLFWIQYLLYPLQVQYHLICPWSTGIPWKHLITTIAERDPNHQSCWINLAALSNIIRKQALNALLRAINEVVRHAIPNPLNCNWIRKCSPILIEIVFEFITDIWIGLL